MRAANTLSMIADSTVDFLIAVTALSVLTALLLQALRDAGLRAPLHRWWIRSWLDWRADKRAAILEKDSDLRLPKKAFAEIGTLGKRAMDLPHSQLCGQLSARAHAQISLKQTTALVDLLEWIDPPLPSPVAEPNTPIDAGARLTRVEQGIDDLQLFLEWRWRLFDYGVAALMVVTFVALSTAWARRTGTTVDRVPFTLYVTISAAAAILVPQVRPVLERLLRARP
jgi:hypothetical protein